MAHLPTAEALAALSGLIRRLHRDSRAPVTKHEPATCGDCPLIHDTSDALHMEYRCGHPEADGELVSPRSRPPACRLTGRFLVLWVSGGA